MPAETKRADSESILDVRSVSKHFHGVPALRDVNFRVDEPQTLALVGENGAGKSTLLKILGGVWPHGTYEGSVSLHGVAAQFRGPLDARKAGVSVIHQELCLFPHLTVAENLFLTDAFPYDGQPSQRLTERVRWRELRSKAAELLGSLGFALDPAAPLSRLRVAERQLVEIARAVHHKARILVLDEPTSALSTAEIERLFVAIGDLRRSGTTCLYVSHKFDEVFALADRIVVLRDGSSVADLDAKKTSEDELIRHMVGRSVLLQRPAQAPKVGPVALDVRNLAHRNEHGAQVLENISFHVRRGEILGIAGLLGAGRTELLRSLAGALAGERTGEVRLHGKEAPWTDVGGALRAGLAYVPEDRKRDGLFLDRSVDFNAALGVLATKPGIFGRVPHDGANGSTKSFLDRFRVRCADRSAPVRRLSGGNQQKVLLARTVATLAASHDPTESVLLLDEPTRGVDVGAKEEIYEAIRELAATGAALVVVSSELPELLALCTRILVLREGRLAGEVEGESVTQEAIMRLAVRPAGEEKR